jgi:hypothetical protein
LHMPRNVDHRAPAQKSVQRPSNPKDFELPFCHGAKNFCVCSQCVWKGAAIARISTERRIKSCETTIRRMGRGDTLVAEVYWLDCSQPSTNSGARPNSSTAMQSIAISWH